jgi:hypothetical protein
MAGVAGTPVAPTYDNVRLAGPSGLRYPLEVHNATFVVSKELDIDFTKMLSPVVLTPDQAGGNYFTFANGAVASTVQFPFGNSSKIFAVANHSGSAVTVQVAAGPGVAASTGVSVANNFRQLLVLDRSLGDVRPLAAAIAY